MTKYLLLIPVLILAGCADKTSDRAIASMNAVEDTTMSSLMLTAADPKEAVNYFSRATAEHPDRGDLQRGLASALIRDGQAEEAVKIWSRIASEPNATDADRIALADAYLRKGDWKAARTAVSSVPPTVETYDRYRIEAIIADNERNWSKADSFYDTAVGLSPRPSVILNNWGFSKLSRGDAKGAEKLFSDALRYDPTGFTTKNNLVLARAMQRKYDLPIMDMTQQERAQFLYTAGLSAIKQGDMQTGRSLLEDAAETAPSHFEEATRAISALDGPTP